jgi:hypothetical protein
VDEVELIWDYNKEGGNYTMKLSYQAMIIARVTVDDWWVKKIWKIWSPQKVLCSSGLLLRGSYLLWKSFSAKVSTCEVYVFCANMMRNQTFIFFYLVSSPRKNGKKLNLFWVCKIFGINIM